MNLALKELFSTKKSKKSNQELKQDIPVKYIGNIIQTSDSKYKAIGKVSPINGELLSEDDLEGVFEAVESALNSFEGRVGIYIQSERIDIENNLINIEKKKQQTNSEMKVILLDEQKSYLESMSSKSRNVLNFYIVLETSSNKYGVAEQILDDALNNMRTELESENMYVNQLHELEIKRVLYERMNPESSMVEPFQEHWGIKEISPSLIKKPKDYKHLEIDDRYFRFFSITDYPQYAAKFRWLKKIFKVNGDINIAITLNPKNKNKIQKELDNAVREVGAKAKDTTNTASETRKYEKQKESAEALIDTLADENSNLYDTNITIAVSDKTQDKLHTLVQKLRSAISASKCKSTELKHKGLDPFWTTLPILANNKITQNYVWNLTSSDIASLIPFDSSELMESDGVLQGENVTSKGLIIVNPFNKKLYNNPHLAIIADSGSGKSFYLQADAIRHYPYRDYIIMFDVEGEFYFPWGKRYKFTPTSGIVTNPFHIRNTIIDTDDHEDGKIDVGGFLAKKIMDLIVFFKWILPDMTPFDESLLEEDIREAYKEKGITFESPSLPEEFPTLSTLEMVMERHINDEKRSAKEKEHRINMKASLNPYINGAYAKMFNGQTNWEYDPMTVFDISQVADAVRPPLYDILLKDTWQFVKVDRTKTKRIYVDEAHEFADPERPQTLKFVSTLIKRGRKYGVSIVTATQNLPDFLSIPRYGQAIIDNSFFKLFFRLGETDIPVAKKLYSFSEKEMKIIKPKQGSKTGKGKGIFIAGSQRVEIQTRASRFELEIIDPQQYEEIYKEKSRYRRAS